MSKRERIISILLVIVFFCYAILLVKILFLSRVSLGELFNAQLELNRSVNLIPFHSISDFLSGSTANGARFAWGNLMGNIVLFVPFGLLLPFLRKNKKVLPTLLVIFLASLAAEAIQGLLAIGTADIDDIILNCLGGLLGILGYRLSVLVFREENRARTVITILSAVIGLPLIFYYLFFIRMRL